MLPQRAKGEEGRQRQRIELQRGNLKWAKWAALGECVCVCGDCMCAEGFFKLMIN